MNYKIKIFQLFILTLIILPGFIWMLLTGKISEAVSPRTMIYDDSLSSGWQNWSWNTSTNYNATDIIKSGTKAMEVTFNNWGGLYFHNNTGLDASTAASLSFSLRTVQPNTKFLIILYDTNNRPIGTPQEITTYGEKPNEKTWTDYTIPLPQSTIKGIAIQDISGNTNKVYIDEFYVNNKNISSQSTTTSSNQIYDETLADGWQNWSWDSTVQFANASNAYSGNKSIAFSANTPWAGLYLHTEKPVDTQSLKYVQFAFRPSQDNQKFSIMLFDEYYTLLSSPVALEKYGTTSAGNYKLYKIPLSDLGASSKKITGIIMQEASGSPQPFVYIDALSFTTDQIVTIPTIVTPTSVAAIATPASANKKFTTLSAGSPLPTGEECASMVRRSSWEPRPENYEANNRKGTLLTTAIDGANEAGNAKYKKRIDGNFTGTTDEIIQWGACKWGLDEEIVRAVAAQESWWRQSTKGDFNGSEYESYGLLQVRRTYHKGTYPLAYESVPFNVDYALGWRRACMDGYFDWIPASSKGDEWGCVGLWFSGRWYDGDASVDHSGANWYIAKVKGYLNEKPWLKSTF